MYRERLRRSLGRWAINRGGAKGFVRRPPRHLWKITARGRERGFRCDTLETTPIWEGDHP